MVKIRLISAYVILIMLFVAVSCQKPNSSEYPDSTTCFPLETTDEQKDLSPYIDSIQVIPLINENGQSLLDIELASALFSACSSPTPFHEHTSCEGAF